MVRVIGAALFMTAMVLAVVAIERPVLRLFWVGAVVGLGGVALFWTGAFLRGRGR